MTDQVDDSYIETKLFPIPPPAPSALVTRARLTMRLEDALTRARLTVVTAPAGFGKTTLLSAWWALSATRARRTAWLSLDRGDQDPVHFWTYLIEALRRVDDRIGTRAITLVRASPSLPPQSIVASLVHDFVRTLEPFSLVVDDFHLVEDSAVAASFSALVQSLPAHVRVLVASRTEPPLGLARLRALGQLGELGVDDLRFTRDEARELLESATDQPLEAEVLETLMDRTEGWVTGLRLAGLSLSGRPDSRAFLADFAGSHRFVLDYLFDEVILRQPKRVQVFLLDTCVLDRLTGPLCDVVTETAGGQQMLDRLERTGLFTVALDAARHWYRYHHLFAEALRARLDMTDPQRASVLHRRASDWFERARSMDEAVRHAVAAGDFERAAALVERSADRLWMRSEVTTLLAWLDEFPADFLATRPTLGVYRAWAMFFTNRIEAVEAELAMVESRLSGALSLAAGRIATLVLAIRACVASVTGQHRAAIELSRRALAGLTDEPVWRTVVLQSLGTGLRAAGEVDAATRAFEEARGAAAQHGDVSGVIYSATNLGLLRQATGELNGAEATYRDAIARAQSVGGSELPIVGMALAGLANVVRERNELPLAADLAAEAHRLGVLGNYGDIMADALLVQARICFARGQATEARAVLDEATGIVERQHVTSRVSAELIELRMRVLIEARDIQAAAALVPLPNAEAPVFERYPEWLGLARLKKAQGHFDAAGEMLGNLRRADESSGRWGSALKALALEALCLEAAGRTDEALVAIARALDLAASGGWVRVLADEGYEMAQLLAKFAETVDIRSSPAAEAYARRIIGAINPIEQSSPAAGISPRELEILRLMATGLSNVEIAALLVVTRTTVKTHVNNLYRKLDARNRVQALGRARQLGLLS